MIKKQLLLSVFFMFLFGVHGAFAASITITPSGNGAFVINGNGMDGVAGIELNILYSAPALASPSVTQGGLVSGALIAANTNNPGAIKIGIISTKSFTGSGQVASISFATHSGTGTISVSSSMINSKGAPVTGGGKTTATDFKTSSPDSTGFIQSAGIPFSQPNTAATSTTTTTTATAPTSTPAYLGTVSMPSDISTKGDTKSADTKPTDTSVVPEQRPEPETTVPDEPSTEETPASEPQKPQTVKTTSYKGTVDDFRAFTGEKSPANLIALFNREIAPNIHQNPAIALSDGKNSLKILVKIESAADKSPNFALNGAKLVSLKKDEASSTWIIEVLPQTGAEQAHLTIMTDSDIIKYPITLTPPVAAVSPDEAAFADFLADSGAVKPKRDLNSDGKHDYLDDFIYTANYLIKKSPAGTKK